MLRLSTEQLLDAVRRVAAFSDEKAKKALETEKHVVIRSTDKKISFYVYNLTAIMVAWMKPDEPQSIPEVVIPVHKFYDQLRAINTEAVELDTLADGDIIKQFLLQAKVGNRTRKLRFQNVGIKKHRPAPPVVGKDYWLRVSPKEFCDAINKASKCIDKTPDRFRSTRDIVLRFNTEAGKPLTLEVIGANRATMARTTLQMTTGHPSTVDRGLGGLFILDFRTAQTIRKACETLPPDAMLSFCRTKAREDGHFGLGVTVEEYFYIEVRPKVIELPNIDSIFSIQSPYTLKVKRSDIMSALIQVVIQSTGDKNEVAFWKLSKDTLSLTAEDGAIITANIDIGCEYDGPNEEVAFMSGYFQTGLEMVTADMLEIKLTNRSMPFVIHEGNTDFYVMPAAKRRLCVG